MLAPHFSEAEMGYDRTPDQYKGNVRRLAYLLEELRGIAGVAFRVTSVWRSSDQNEAAGGVQTSRHLTGEAADFVPVGLSPLTFWERLKAAELAGRAPAWGELELDLTDGHVHVTLARFGAKNGEVFIVSSSGTSIVRAGRVAAIGGAVLLVLLLGMALYRGNA